MPNKGVTLKRGIGKRYLIPKLRFNNVVTIKNAAKFNRSKININQSNMKNKKYSSRNFVTQYRKHILHNLKKKGKLLANNNNISSFVNAKGNNNNNNNISSFVNAKGFNNNNNISSFVNARGFNNV